MQSRGIHGQKIPKSANIICERPLTLKVKNNNVHVTIKRILNNVWFGCDAQVTHQSKFCLIRLAKMEKKVAPSDMNWPQNKTIVSRPFATLVVWTKVRWTPTNFMFITILAKAKIGYTIVPIIIEIANMITFRETLMHSEVKIKFLCKSFNFLQTLYCHLLLWKDSDQKVAK